MVSSLISSRTTMTVFLPDQEFDHYYQHFSSRGKPNLKRSSTDSQQYGPSMAAQSASGRSSDSHQSSAYSDARQPTSHASRTGRRSAHGYDDCYTSVSRNDSGYASSNVTGYRRCLDVAGSPPGHYFTSGLSQYDRRPEYIEDNRGESQVSRRSSRRSDKGMDMVKYEQPYPRQCETFEDSFGTEDDLGTVLPCDSISNVSSRWSTDSRRWYGRGRFSGGEMRPAIGLGWSQTHAEWTSGYSRRGYGGDDAFRLTERTPGRR